MLWVMLALAVAWALVLPLLYAFDRRIAGISAGAVSG
jgi:hypothetical protein